VFPSLYSWHRIISSIGPSAEGTLQSNSKNDKSLARGDVFLIWLDASPRQKHQVVPVQRLKGEHYQMYHDDLQMMCSISNKCLRLAQGAHFWSHVWSANQHIQKARGSWLAVSYSAKLMFFTRVAPVQKARGSWLVVPYSVKLMFLHA
jgi:hypothetical protein